MDLGQWPDRKMRGKGSNQPEHVELRKKLIAMNVDKALMLTIMGMVMKNQELIKHSIPELLAMAKSKSST